MHVLVIVSKGFKCVIYMDNVSMNTIECEVRCFLEITVYNRLVVKEPGRTLVSNAAMISLLTN